MLTHFCSVVCRWWQVTSRVWPQRGSGHLSSTISKQGGGFSANILQQGYSTEWPQSRTSVMGSLHASTRAPCRARVGKATLSRRSSSRSSSTALAPCSCSSPCSCPCPCPAPPPEPMLPVMHSTAGGPAPAQGSHVPTACAAQQATCTSCPQTGWAAETSASQAGGCSSPEAVHSKAR
ncbi:hypothetical protein B484DRAFT_443814 [Ochromonadaceae sp. CCMP2298]|nr:hypothetical protein B484DRAFT_443814 [Ochromonadaceae sp. CCMP2298]